MIISDNISANQVMCVFLESGLMIPDSWMSYSFDLIGRMGLQKKFMNQFDSFGKFAHSLQWFLTPQK